MADHPAWKDLGAALKKRRRDLGYTSLTEFAADRHIKWRTAWNLEKGDKDSHSGTTLLAADAAYGLQPGSCEKFLNGGELVPVADPGLFDDLPAEDQETVRAFIEVVRRQRAARRHGG